MSKIYSLEITLTTEPQQSTIAQILKIGSTKNIHYPERNSYFDSANKAKQLTHEQASHILYSDISKRLNTEYVSSTEYISGVFCKCENTVFTLDAYEKDGYLQIMMLPLSYYWYIYHNENRYIDFDRYTRLLLDLCKDLPIIKLETITE